MFAELERSEHTFEYKGSVVRLRYDIAALIRLERRSLSYEDIFGDSISGAKPDMKKLRCLICDIMGKPESFFRRSTLRELLERWQEYAVVKGLAKEPERMEMFDTEGME